MDCKQLIKLMSDDYRYGKCSGAISVKELAVKAEMPLVEVHKRLGLYKIPMGTGIGADVDSGIICVQNAYALAMLPVDYQYEYWRRAKTLAPSEFVQLIRDKKRYGYSL
jgi:hypothetical protein